MRTEKNLDYYVGLPYKIELFANEERTGYYAEIAALRGCLAFGETVEEALDILPEIKRAWMERALERGWPIPEPEDASLKEYSGRFNVRLPRYLHRELAGLAEAENTSLNQLVVALLGEGVERRRQRRRAVQPFFTTLFHLPGYNRLCARLLEAFLEAERSAGVWALNLQEVTRSTRVRLTHYGDSNESPAPRYLLQQ